MAETTVFIRPDELWRELGLQAGQTVVHLGSGPGFYLIPAARIVGTHGKVIGVDIQLQLLAEAESRAAREDLTKIIHTVRSDLEQPSGSTLPADQADWVLIANILHQSDPVKILTEGKRIVSPQGNIVVIEWDTVATPLGPPPEIRVSRHKVEQVAAELGLQKKSAIKPSPYHYGLIFSKEKSDQK